MSAKNKLKVFATGVGRTAANVGKGAVALVALPVTEFLDEWLGILSRLEAKPRGGTVHYVGKKRGEPKWWKVLGIPKTASTAEIKFAYRELISRNHPDKVAHLSPKLRKVAENEAKKLNAAYLNAIADRSSSDAA